jgi:hypothetical protein
MANGDDKQAKPAEPDFIPDAPQSAQPDFIPDAAPLQKPSYPPTEPKEGFLEHTLGTLKNQAYGFVEPLMTGVDAYNQARKAGQGVLSSLGTGAVASSAEEGPVPLSRIANMANVATGEEYRRERARSMNPVYSTLAPIVAPAVGINLQDMEHQADIGNTAGVFAAGAVPAAEALGAYGISRGLPAVRNAAMEEPDVAAQRALAPPKARAIRAQGNLAVARPYLQGAQDLEDLQAKIGPAKSEIWNPYAKAVQDRANVVVDGPDGPTSIADLEQQRLETSAQLDSVRNMKASDTQTAMQKNQIAKELSDRYDAITDALDPVLRSTGIDPKLIRQTFGNVKGISKLVEGRNTLTERDQPYGFGRISNISLAKPRSWLGEPMQGVRDLIAGRPLWSGKPTDIAVKEGFRVGGQKPNLVPGGVFNPPLTSADRMLPAVGQTGFGNALDETQASGVPNMVPRPIELGATNEVSNSGPLARIGGRAYTSPRSALYTPPPAPWNGQPTEGTSPPPPFAQKAYPLAKIPGNVPRTVYGPSGQNIEPASTPPPVNQMPSRLLLSASPREASISPAIGRYRTAGVVRVNPNAEVAAGVPERQLPLKNLETHVAPPSEPASTRLNHGKVEIWNPDKQRWEPAR